LTVDQSVIERGHYRFKNVSMDNTVDHYML
jgi:hypothetical protein